MADSLGGDLRQQLANEGGMGTATINYVWPLVEAWGDARVAAARAEIAEQIAEAIEIICQVAEIDGLSYDFRRGCALGAEIARTLAHPSTGAEPKDAKCP